MAGASGRRFDPFATALSATENASSVPVSQKDLPALLRTGEGEPSHVRALFGDVDLNRLRRMADILDIDGETLARAYRNKQELSPHTDSCDLIGLACLRDAKTGGVSRLTSALTVHNVMREEYPESLEHLYRGYVFHRRGEEKPGDLPYTPYRVPVYSNTGGKVSARYVRTYVEAGEAAAGRPMGEAELAVLDRFEEVTKRPELMLEFTLRPGEIYFINNYTILHARTAFDDGDAEEDRRRHLLRLWLEVPQMRPVHPHIRSGGIEAVPGRTPSFDWSKLTNNRN